MKLSKTQQKVIGLMKKGWRLTSLMGLYPNASIYDVSPDNTGNYNYNALVVSMATICALMHKGIIKAIEQFPINKYELTEKGKQIGGD